MKIKRDSAREDDFDAIVLSELEILKSGEQRLQRLFPQLRSQPHLRNYFLLKLTEVCQRVKRLNAVLNPLSISEPSSTFAIPTIKPAA